MRAGQVFVVYRSAALSLAKSNMRRRQAKDPSGVDDQRICTKANCLRCCKKFTAFMFSRVGLFLVMIGYVAFGGVLFQALEAGNEMDMRRAMSVELNSTLYKLWDEMLRVNSFPYNDKKGNFSKYASNELEKFELTVIRQVQQGFDGRTADAEQDWSYFGAVLYAVTLISTIGYGHITTKTTQGKIATILYSAFGVPLMMLFVANIGSTMANMFAFVFSRITMIFCCRMSNKKKCALALKNRQKLVEKTKQPEIMIDGKIPISVADEETKEIGLGRKSSLKTIKDENIEETILSKQTNLSTSISLNSSTTDVDISTNLKLLPADIRLNMLTGVPNKNTPRRSLTSSVNSVGERSKDALVRINELIRQNSVQDVEDKTEQILNYEQKRRRSIDISPIQYYIDETNKLTTNLDTSTVSVEKQEQEETSTENNMKQVDISEDTPNVDNTKESKKSSKKQLKRSKSESTHNRRSHKKLVNELPSIKDNESPNTTTPTKPTRRRFFSRKSDKLKRQSPVEEEGNKSSLHRQMSAMEVRQVNEKDKKLTRKSQSFKEHSPRSLPPPPDYEQSTNEITPLPTTVTWKSENQFYPTKTTYDLTNLDGEDDEDYDEDEEMSVPLLVTVFVIPLYLTLGAILFNTWEKWGFLNSFYFCFITLTTIGFGDFVPGSAMKVEDEKAKLISAALYILLGLVLIAMCVNLMKEQLSQKVKRVASKLGNF